MNLYDMVLVLLFVLIVVNIRKYYNARVIDYGWILAWQDGNVYVVTRLLKSPAGRAGVAIGNRILSWNDTPMSFASAAEFEAWGHSHAPRTVGEKVRVVIAAYETRREVTMAADWVEKRIPIHSSNPDSRHSNPLLLRSNPRVCPKTGVVYTSFTLTDEATAA